MKVLFLNCTLKYAPDISNTEALILKAKKEYEKFDAECEIVRINDYNIKFGVSSDEGGGDEWPKVLEKIKQADILIVGMPIWFGVRSSVAQLLIERLDGTYDEVDKTTGQFPLYNKIAGVMVTGNEDGAHDCCATTLYNLSHLGCVVPPNSDSYWVGDAGPGPSYIEAGGDKHLYTNKTTKFMVRNTLHMAKVMKEMPLKINLSEVIEEAKKESR